MSQALACVREVALRNRRERFTSLMHHITPDLLAWAFQQLKPKAAPGVDGVTWEQYAVALDGHIDDLHRRVMCGAYRAKPSRRQYIPKPDGRQRPLGIAALEDKIVQRAMVDVLNAIYETDFLGFSYGFRPGRSQHDALDALAYAGLNPSHHRSGSSIDRPTRISKIGNAGLRSALYMPALAAMRFNPAIAALRARLTSAGRLKPKQIVVAAMRKLLVLCFGVLKTGKRFDPSIATPA